MSIVVYWKGSLREISQGEIATVFKSLNLNRQQHTIEDLQANCHKAKLDSYRLVVRDPTLGELEQIPINLAKGHCTHFPDFWTPSVIEQYQVVKELDKNFQPISSPSFFSPASSPTSHQPTPVLPIVQQPVDTPPARNLFGSEGTSNKMDIATLITNAIGSITFIDVSIFDYQGFDPLKIRDLILDRGTKMNTQKLIVGKQQISFLGNSIGNDVAFMVTLGLLRGNGLTKIEQKSLPELNTVLNLMKNSYRLVEKTERVPTAITLMRVVNAFPEVAYAALKAGRGRDITGLGFTPILANSVSFQMVHNDNFKDYAMHFLYVNHMVDKVINKPPKKMTDLKELWNYMISYNSPAAPKGNSRLRDIGTPSAPTKEHFSFQANPYWQQIEQKIATNDASVL